MGCSEVLFVKFVIADKFKGLFSAVDFKHAVIKRKKPILILFIENR